MMQLSKAGLKLEIALRVTTAEHGSYNRCYPIDPGPDLDHGQINENEIALLNSMNREAGISFGSGSLRL